MKIRELLEGRVEPDAPNADAIARKKAREAAQRRREEKAEADADDLSKDYKPKGSKSSDTVKVSGKAYGGSSQKDIDESKKKSKEPPKPRNFVAKNAQTTTSGAGAHKDKKRAEKQGDVKHKKDVIPMDETATAGATSAANIGTVDAPQLSPGKARGKKSYIGSPGKSGTKAPPQPKVIQPKTAGGVAKNALDMKGANIFGAPIKR